jgi:hypothetical protein
MAANKGGDAHVGKVAHARGNWRSATETKADTPPSTHSPSTPPSDARLALRRGRGASELQPGSALGRSASDYGTGYLHYHHRL